LGGGAEGCIGVVGGGCTGVVGRGDWQRMYTLYRGCGRRVMYRECGDDVPGLCGRMFAVQGLYEKMSGVSVRGMSGVSVRGAGVISLARSQGPQYTMHLNLLIFPILAPTFSKHPGLIHVFMLLPLLVSNIRHKISTENVFLEILEISLHKKVIQ